MHYILVIVLSFLYKIKILYLSQSESEQLTDFILGFTNTILYLKLYFCQEEISLNHLATVKTRDVYAFLTPCTLS